MRIWSILKADYVVTTADNLENKFGADGAKWLMIAIFGAIILLFLAWVIWLIFQITHTNNEKDESKKSTIENPANLSNLEKDSISNSQTNTQESD